MKTIPIVLAASIASMVTTTTSSALAQRGLAAVSTRPQGMHDFDFEFGQWQVHHRVKNEAGGGSWMEFDGTCTTRPFMAGQGDIEEHVFARPTGISYGTAIRAFDPKTQEWAIWWIDSRYPHYALDPPVKGRFENGLGTFYSDGPVNGKIVRTRFIWSQITASSAHWEQAISGDAGKTWDTNWIMEFRRVASEPAMRQP